MNRLRPLLVAAAIAAPSLAQTPAAPYAAGQTIAARAWQQFTAQSHVALAGLHPTDRAALPAPPEGVTDLAFAELFGPVGDRGLEYSAKLRALEGQQVRLSGCMVREAARMPGGFLFAGRPATAETRGRCSPDTVPASAVHVVLGEAARRPVPYRPGWLSLIGRIELGPRDEADGSKSFVRLVLLPEASASFPSP